MVCNTTESCTLGTWIPTRCQALDNITCEEPRSFVRLYLCQYCYQADQKYHHCSQDTSCYSGDRVRSLVTCTTDESLICLGNREFEKFDTCNFQSGKRWSTALALSILLGGFGVDRFYLGMHGWGVFKMLTFGGCGIWTIIDAVLIGIGYLRPADGSLYRDE
eukprot:c6386_g1_i1.p1 GENE.c6386_g1_i1~~c6386_g1_i1.p1  ORF type:complete len:162 (+),score=7.49 c6386_g1_i1:154-639(+)